MMEEIVDREADPHVDHDSVIRDALQDAAQTYVAESLQHLTTDDLHVSRTDSSDELGTASAAVSEQASSVSSSLIAGPTPLPSSVVSGDLSLSGLTAASSSTIPGFFADEKSPPSSFTTDVMLGRQPVLPSVGYSYDVAPAGSVAPTGVAGPALPPPPTMGFIPSHGIVTANPTKHYSVSPLAPTDTTAHIFTPSAVVQTPAAEEIPRGGYTAAPHVPYSEPVGASLPSNYSQGVAMNLSCESPPASYVTYTSADHHHEPVSPQKSEGFFGWLPGSGLVHKVLEKTKSSVESVITTLDPGMKEVIYSGGNINIVVTSTKDVKVGAIRQAFQTVFGRATVTGMESQPTIAPQPVGYSSGFRGAEERIENLRQSGVVDENQVLVSAENFIVELLPDRWYDIGCIVLKDPRHGIELTTFSQATPVPADFLCIAQDATPSDYPLRWSGLAMTIGQAIMQREPHVDHADWHLHYTGVSRRDMLTSAARALAGMYRSQLSSLGYVF